MANIGFTRKKVESMTLGEKLKKIRSEYRISLSEVVKHTKIRMKYLEYLENGEYEKLPAPVYVRGFVRSYANFLGTDERVLVKLYEREYNIQRNLKKDSFQDQNERHFEFPGWAITPKLLLSLIGFCLVAGGFFYLYREFRAFASEPRLVIEEPSEGQIVLGDSVLVRGITDKDAYIGVNGQSLLVLEEGNFSERIHLQSGANTLTVTATNKFKKEKTLQIFVQAKYESSVSDNSLPAQLLSENLSKKRFELRVSDRALRVRVEADGTVVHNGAFDFESTRIFEAAQSLKVSSDDGSKTFIREGNGEEMPLSQASEEVKDRLFEVHSPNP